MFLSHIEGGTSFCYKCCFDALSIRRNPSERLPLPIYHTSSDVPNPGAFTSTVEVDDIIFEREPAHNKKQAEINAAKVAFQHPN
ncbi:hypothetical protein EJB05_13199, partial [Eragrostis curvula]